MTDVRNLPLFVWREFERFERCGDPAYGFAWLVCDPCAHHRLVPFSCGGRGFCPTCGGRRMAALAAHWVDRVLPEVGLRQWVVTVPWERRWLLARRPDLARKPYGPPRIIDSSQVTSRQSWAAFADTGGPLQAVPA